MVSEPVAQVTRNGRVESVHLGRIVVVDNSGGIVLLRGDAGLPVYWRSSAKPFQAITCLAHRAGREYEWTDAELAVVCASHSAEPGHLAVVEKLLSKAEVNEDKLGCGPHPPLSTKERDRLIVEGKPPRKIHNNCSGKHAGMLATCNCEDWPIESYLEGGHPLQQENVKTVARFAGLAPSAIEWGVDGCGVPAFWAPLHGLALAYARLGSANDSELRDSDLEQSVNVVRAMTTHPEMVAGTGRLDTDLMQFAPGKLLAKTGAEGVYGISIPESGLGIAIKIDDGHARAMTAIVCRLLAEFLPDYPWDDLRKRIDPPISNTRKEVVGSVDAVF